MTNKKLSNNLPAFMVFLISRSEYNKKILLAYTAYTSLVLLNRKIDTVLILLK